MKYRKKPIVVEAMQFPDNGPEQNLVKAWVNAKGGNLKTAYAKLQKKVKTSKRMLWRPFSDRSWTDTPNGISWRWTSAWIDTPAGNMKVNIGDWIIKGVSGEFYHCSADIFKATYELVEDDEN